MKDVMQKKMIITKTAPSIVQQILMTNSDTLVATHQAADVAQLAECPAFNRVGHEPDKECIALILLSFLSELLLLPRTLNGTTTTTQS